MIGLSLIPLPYRLAAGALAIVGTFGAGWIKGNSHGQEIGDRKVAAQRQQFDAALSAAEQAKAKAEAHAIDVERASNVRLANIAEGYEKDIADENEKHNRAIAAIRSGKRLRVDIASASRACSGKVPAAAAATGQRDGTETAELSGPVGERLVEFANAADNLAVQLRACQQVIIEDRRAINGTDTPPQN